LWLSQAPRPRPCNWWLATYKTTTTSTDQQRFDIDPIFVLPFADAEILIDGVVFTLDAVGERRPATLYTLGVTAVARGRVVDDIDVVICTTLVHAAVVLTVVLACEAVRETVGRTRLT